MHVNAINNFNTIKFSQKTKIEEYKKLQAARNFKATHFSELSQDERDKVFIRIAELNNKSKNPLAQALEKFLISSCNK